MTDQLKKLWAECFSDPPEAIHSFFAAAYSPERCRYLERNGQIAAALHWLDGTYQGQKVAYLYAVATRPGLPRPRTLPGADGENPSGAGPGGLCFRPALPPPGRDCAGCTPAWATGTAASAGNSPVKPEQR